MNYCTYRKIIIYNWLLLVIILSFIIICDVLSRTFWNKNRCFHLLFTFLPVSFGLSPKQTKKKWIKKQNKHKQLFGLDFCIPAKSKNHKNQRNQIELHYFLTNSANLLFQLYQRRHNKMKNVVILYTYMYIFFFFAKFEFTGDDNLNNVKHIITYTFQDTSTIQIEYIDRTFALFSSISTCHL